VPTPFIGGLAEILEHKTPPASEMRRACRHLLDPLVLDRAAVSGQDHGLGHCLVEVGLGDQVASGIGGEVEVGPEIRRHEIQVIVGVFSDVGPHEGTERQDS
jgi:hypothetical protein